MDAQTLQVYQQQAATFAEAMRSAEPTSFYALIRGFLHVGAATADIGCGSGRDTAWLSREGYPTTGYDASPAMLAAARQAYPELDLREASLPDLAAIADGSYQNVLCSAVLMHLQREDLIGAALNLARILQPGGRLILSYRASRTGGEREPDGRLFTPIPPGRLALLLESAGMQMVSMTDQVDSVRSDVRWHILVVEKSPLLAPVGSNGSSVCWRRIARWRPTSLL